MQKQIALLEPAELNPVQLIQCERARSGAEAEHPGFASISPFESTANSTKIARIQHQLESGICRVFEPDQQTLPTPKFVRDEIDPLPVFPVDAQNPSLDSANAKIPAEVGVEWVYPFDGDIAQGIAQNLGWGDCGGWW